MAVAGREAGEILPTADLLVWRSLLGLAVVSLIVRRSAGGFQQLRTGQARLHVARNLFHFAGQYCWYSAIVMIPLAQVFALEFTAPIWMLLAAPFVLGERFTVAKAAAGIIGFIGVLIVVRPFDGQIALSLNAGQILALGAAIAFAGNLLITKRLSATETSLCILFYMTLMQAPIGMFMSGGLPMVPPDLHTGLWVLILSLAALSAHFCLAEAFRHADATIVAPMDFARLPLIAIVGMIVYGEPFDLYVLIGGVLIFFVNYIQLRRR